MPPVWLRSFMVDLARFTANCEQSVLRCPTPLFYLLFHVSQAGAENRRNRSKNIQDGECAGRNPPEVPVYYIRERRSCSHGRCCLADRWAWPRAWAAWVSLAKDGSTSTGHDVLPWVTFQTRVVGQSSVMAWKVDSLILNWWNFILIGLDWLTNYIAHKKPEWRMIQKYKKICHWD